MQWLITWRSRRRDGASVLENCFSENGAARVKVGDSVRA